MNYKNCLILLNLIFVIFGITLIVFSVNTLDMAPLAIPIIPGTDIALGICILGCFIFIIAFLGFYGAIKNNQQLLYSYSFFLFIMIICQVGIGTTAYLFPDKLTDKLTKGLDEVCNIYQGGSTNPNFSQQEANITLHEIENIFNCCIYTLTENKCDETCIVNQHCCSSIEEYLRTHMHTAGIVVIIFGVIQLLGLVFSLFLCTEISREIKANKLINNARTTNRTPDYGSNNYDSDPILGVE